jgi:hypothetical protein
MLLKNALILLPICAALGQDLAPRVADWGGKGEPHSDTIQTTAWLKFSPIEWKWIGKRTVESWRPCRNCPV